MLGGVGLPDNRRLDGRVRRDEGGVAAEVAGEMLVAASTEERCWCFSAEETTRRAEMGGRVET
jgi:hypothetical protein